MRVEILGMYSMTTSGEDPRFYRKIEVREGNERNKRNGKWLS